MHSRRKCGAGGLGPGKFRVFPGQYYAFWLLALFINVVKNNFAKILRLSDLTSCAGGREFESQRPAKSYTALQAVRHRF